MSSHYHAATHVWCSHVEFKQLKHLKIFFSVSSAGWQKKRERMEKIFAIALWINIFNGSHTNKICTFLFLQQYIYAAVERRYYRALLHNLYCIMYVSYIIWFTFFRLLCLWMWWAFTFKTDVLNFWHIQQCFIKFMQIKR